MSPLRYVAIVVAALAFAAPAGAQIRASSRDHARGHTRRLKRNAHTGRQPAMTVRSVPVAFSVTDANTSVVPCSADGRKYTIAGTLVLPAATTPTGVTLYVHGLGFASYFWHFTDVAGYDFAGAEAARGHASVVIDRLGYGASSIPDGNASCVGSQASILHQVIGALRDGGYSATGLPSPPRFTRIGLVGHSAGGQLAEVEAYSFRDVDAVGIVEWADQGYSVGALGAFGDDGLQCATGGSRQRGSASSGYAVFGRTDAQYRALMFAGAGPAVEAAAVQKRTLDPCGQIESVLTGVIVDALRDGTITAPILYVHAGSDGIFTVGIPWPALQEALYSATRKLTDLSLPAVGHAVTLERSANTLQTATSTWLTSNGL